MLPLNILRDYTNFKVKNLIQAQKVDNDNYSASVKNFDPTDGSELVPIIHNFNLNQLNQRIQAKQVELDNLTTFKADLLKLV